MERMEIMNGNENGIYIGMDIGGTKIYIILMKPDGTILYEEKLPTTGDTAEIAGIVRETLSKNGFSENDVIALGAGVPGSVRKGGIVNKSTALGWKDHPLKDLLEAEFPFPVAVGNDTNLMAYGENCFGAGGRVENMIFLAFGTGIGCGIIADGHLLLGKTGRAAEVGYLLSAADVKAGRLNKPGQQGVFEFKCSGTGLGRYGIPAEQVFKNYKEGQRAAVEIINDFVLEVSVWIANCVSLFDPECVVLGGGVADSLSELVGEIRKKVCDLTPIPTEIRLAELGGKAGAMGAAGYARDERARR